MPNTPRRTVAATKIQSVFRGWRTRHGSGFNNLPVLNPWNVRYFEVARPSGIDPISLNNIRAGNVYFSIPTNSPNVRTPLSRTTFVNYVRREYPHLQPRDINPFALMNWNPRAILFQSPITRRTIRVKNVRVHVKPLYRVIEPVNTRNRR